MFRSTPVGGKTEQKVKDIVSAILTATAPEFSKQVALKEAEYELERATKAVEEARKAVEAARALETEARLTLIDAQISLESVSVYFPD
jgi:ABC-type branched-subunit amino acid transport system ATPase component